MTKGQRIRKIREDLGLSQTDLAKKANISKQTLYKYEKNIVTNIPSDCIEKIASVLKCTPAQIMGWDEVETFDTPEEYERRWNAIGGGRHPLDLTDREHDLIIEYRGAPEEDKRMVERVLKYANRLKGGDPNA